MKPEPDITQTPIAFIGGGNMARSLIGGLVSQGKPPATIFVAEPVEALADALHRDFGVHITGDNAAAASAAQLWVFAVKPQVMKAVCEALRALAQAHKPLMVSIAAGISTQQLNGWLGGNVAVVRSMPNTPALLGAGAAGLYANAYVNAQQQQWASQLMQATGISVWVEDEAQMDIVTALSGSGPAYVFLLAEALQAAAVAQGLPENTARVLAQQTLLGASRMLCETNEPADVLRQRVTSPGGTTQAALESFERNQFRRIVADAIGAATERGRQLSAASSTPS